MLHNEINFARFNSRENRRSLAIFHRKGHCASWGLNIARFLQQILLEAQPKSGAQKNPKAKKSHEQHQRISEQSEGVTGHYPMKPGF